MCGVDDYLAQKLKEMEKYSDVEDDDETPDYENHQQDTQKDDKKQEEEPLEHDNERQIE